MENQVIVYRSRLDLKEVFDYRDTMIRNLDDSGEVISGRRETGAFPRDLSC
jgi:hypothetical protein